ncbi:MAG: hypothetical protein JKY08_08070 [Flavobacteriaceae bacterium]|nr:hypothetical protein [Flavobacteriaceae bacterium]
MAIGIAKIGPRDTNLQKNATIVVIPFNGSMAFEVFIYTNTQNKKATKNNIKWLWVEAQYLDSLRKMSQKEKFEHWGKWEDKEKTALDIYGVGINYAKSTSVIIENVSKQKNLIGKKYWLEAFIYYPEFKLPVGKYFVVKGKPSIQSVYFEGTAVGDDKNKVKSKYGKTVNIIINTHALPDIAMKCHNYVVFEVDIYSHEKNKKVTTAPFRSIVNFSEATAELNATIKVGVILENEWRTTTAHDNTGAYRSYYAQVKATHYYNKDATFEGIEKKVGLFGYASDTVFTQQAPNGEIIAIRITKEDWEKEHWLEKVFGRSVTDVKKHAAKYEKKELAFKATDSKGCQLPIYVELPYTSQSDAIEIREIKVGKMIAEIKDQKYTCKNDDPCKFTGIDVKVGTQKKVTIFNENDTSSATEVSDTTSKVFSFVAGDKEKEKITITLKDLSISDYKPGKEYKCYKDIEHSTQNLINPTKVSPQWLVKKGDGNGAHFSYYEIKGNTIQLEIGYIFNKSYDNSVLNYLAYEQSVVKKGLLGEAVRNIWVLRYLLKMINNENMQQSYAIPINTCRYPNQLVRLNVYPDMKWVLNFNYNISTPLYYGVTEETATYSARFHESTDSYGRPLLVSSNSRQRQQILDKEISNALLGISGQETSFNIGIQCQIGNSSPFNLNKLYEKKFQSMLAPLMWIHDFIDSTFGVSDAKQINKKIKAKKVGKFNKLAARLNKLPMSFELIAPQIAMGFGIGYGNANNNNVGYELEGQLLMNPIIGANIKLDVLALGSKFKPWGAIIDALDLVSFATEMLSGGSLQINYELYVQLTAKILLVGNESKDGVTTPANITYNLKDKEFSAGGIALQGVLEGKIVASASLEYKLRYEKGKVLKNYNTKDSKAKIKSFGIGLELEAKSYVSLSLGKSFGKGDNFDADFYFSGVTVKIKVKIGFKGKTEVFKIIPYTEKTINILKNESEYK